MGCNRRCGRGISPEPAHCETISVVQKYRGNSTDALVVMVDKK
jgi:hypothetical protein